MLLQYKSFEKNWTLTKVVISRQINVRSLFVLFLVVISQTFYSQSELTIRLKNSPNHSIKDIIVLNLQDVKPEILNDTIAIYRYSQNIPVYLTIVMDFKSRWHQGVWLNPNQDLVEFVINFNSHSANLLKPKEWDLFTDYWSLYQDNFRLRESDSIASKYIQESPASYLSLWLLGHGVAREDNHLKMKLFNQLSPTLETYEEYNDIKSDINGRRNSKTGDLFKEFCLEDYQGANFDTKYIKNKIIILHFWSNDCSPCVKGMDDFVKFYSSLDTSVLKIISISLDVNKVKWKSSNTSHKIMWSNTWQKGGLYGDLSLHYNLRAIPLFVIFNKEKRLHVIIEGEDLYSIRKEINTLK